jgi:hypothetical protein
MKEATRIRQKTIGPKVNSFFLQPSDHYKKKTSHPFIIFQVFVIDMLRFRLNLL